MQSIRGSRRSRTARRVLLTVIAALTITSTMPRALNVTLAQPASPVPADPGPDPALVNAVAYLLRQQDEAGGFVGPDGQPDPGTTADAILALGAAAQQGVDTEAEIDHAVVYLETDGAAYAGTGAGQAAKVVMALIAGGKDPRAFGDLDLIARLTAPPATPEATPASGVPNGLYGESVFNHALVLLALSAANEPVPPAAIDALRGTQIEDGSWAFAGTREPGTGDSNTTALVIQALVATGNGTDPMVDSALAYLPSVQNEFGQVLFQAGLSEMADANSTALTVQALIAAGQDPTSPEWGNAARGLSVFQNVSGAFRYVDAAPEDNLLATLQAVPALAGYALPVATACEEPAAPRVIDATPQIVELPAPGRGQAPCMPLEPAA